MRPVLVSLIEKGDLAVVDQDFFADTGDAHALQLLLCHEADCFEYDGCILKRKGVYHDEGRLICNIAFCCDDAAGTAGKMGGLAEPASRGRERS